MQYKQKKKLLIIHGWLHSAERYFELAERLSKFTDVDIYEFEGFGGTKFKYRALNILEYYVEKLENYLAGKEYDIVVTHSMGGNILLKVLSKTNYKFNHVILSNTAYLGLPLLKPVVWMLPVTMLSFCVTKFIPRWVTKPIFGKISLLTIQNPKYFDEIMFKDVLRCNSIVAAITIFQLAFDRFKFVKNTRNNEIDFVVTYSENDRVIPLKNTQKLINDLRNPSVKEFKNIGHTVALEARDDYYQMIKDIMDREG